MSSIAHSKHILTVGAGTASAHVLYEIQTSDSPIPKRIIVARKSASSPYVHFLNRAALTLYGIFPATVVELYENTWPSALDTQLTGDGALPDGFNASYSQADFGNGKTGLLSFNNYDITTGSFLPTVKKVYTASKAAATGEVVLPWYKKPVVITGGIIAGIAGVVVFFIYKFTRKKSKK